MSDDMDEDTPVSALQARGNNDEIEAGDEMQDFRFLASMTNTTKQVIPKRGEKDFEPHGTKHQDAVLEASREAMHQVLDHTRTHIPKSHVRGWYLGNVTSHDDLDETMVDVLSQSVRGRGLERDHVVMVENAKGPHFRSTGKTALGILPARLWLLPEEALYLLERGTLDLWWPDDPLAAVRGEYADETLDSEEVHGVPLSLEASYALLLGDEGEEGKVSMDNYNVYENLKRIGYLVMRASSHVSRIDPPPAPHSSSLSLFYKLFGHIFTEKLLPSNPEGPLIQTGLYRSYNNMYRHLNIVPRYDPLHPIDSFSDEPVSPFKLIYYVWKPSRNVTFAKSNPGEPDFRISIVSARSTTVPSLPQLTTLLSSTPWDPPKKHWVGPEKTYQRLRHGWRNVIIAVVDQGIISYLRMSEAAFGEERLYERFDRKWTGGGKRGGGRNRGRGGRGRGRGR